MDDLLTHRCTILRLSTTASDGAPLYTWEPIRTNRPCRFDPSFMRRGKDIGWVQEAGRAPDRAGVLFIGTKEGLLSGDRIQMTSPQELTGMFGVDGAIDQAIDYDGVHHLEVWVTEVPSVERNP